MSVGLFLRKDLIMKQSSNEDISSTWYMILFVRSQLATRSAEHFYADSQIRTAVNGFCTRMTYVCDIILCIVLKPRIDLQYVQHLSYRQVTIRSSMSTYHIFHIYLSSLQLQIMCMQCSRQCFITKHNTSRISSQPIL